MYKACIKQLSLAILLVYSICVSAELFTEGKDYTRLANEIRQKEDVQQTIAADPNKVQVILFFNYGCHGCDLLHTPYEAWVKQQEKKYNNKVKFYSYPVSFNAQWKMLAKFYYVAQALDPSGKMHEKIFFELHKKGLKLWQEDVMKNFFVQQGFDKTKVDNVFKSFSGFQKAKRADEVSIAYDITVTPDVVINGPIASYKVELAKVGNSVQRFFEVLSYIIERETKLLPNVSS